MSSPVLYVRLIYQKGQYRMVSMHVLTCVALCVRSVNGSTHSMMSSPVLPENDVLTCVAREWYHHLCCLRMLSSPVLPENDALHLCCLRMMSSPEVSENDVLNVLPKNDGLPAAPEKDVLT